MGPGILVSWGGFEMGLIIAEERREEETTENKNTEMR